MMQPVIISARQSHRPVAIALQADIQTFVRIKHRQRDFRRVEKAQPKIDARMLALLSGDKRTPRPTIPRKKRILPFPRHRAKLRREKFSQLMIPFENVTVGVDDRERSFHGFLLQHFLAASTVLLLPHRYCVNTSARKPQRCYPPRPLREILALLLLKISLLRTKMRYRMLSVRTKDIEGGTHNGQHNFHSSRGRSGH